MTIQYRCAVIEDFAAIVDLFVDNMDLSVFTTVNDKLALRQLATIFLAKDCHRATFIQVAEYNGIICGVIIGVTKGAPHKALLFNHKSIIKQAENGLRLSKQGRQVLSDLQVKDRQTKDAASTQRKDIDFDSELQFFCVNQNYRRYRIGTILMRAFEDYLITQGATTYALHTDTLCTYQYYENNGYQRMDQYPNHLRPQVEHYTYIKALS